MDFCGRKWTTRGAVCSPWPPCGCPGRKAAGASLGRSASAEENSLTGGDSASSLSFGWGRNALGVRLCVLGHVCSTGLLYRSNERHQQREALSFSPGGWAGPVSGWLWRCRAGQSAAFRLVPAGQRTSGGAAATNRKHWAGERGNFKMALSAPIGSTANWTTGDPQGRQASCMPNLPASQVLTTVSVQ